MNKVFANADEAVPTSPTAPRSSPAASASAASPRTASRALRELGTKDLTFVSQQLRRRRLRPRHPARATSRSEDDLELRRREQGVRAAVPLGRARGRAHAAGHARRAPPRRRRRHPGVLHADRRRHRGQRRRPAAHVRRRRHRREGAARRRRSREFDGRDYVLERGDHRRLRDREGVEGRPLRQPRLPPHRDELQPADGDRRRRSPSPRSRSSSRSARSIPITSTRRASSCSASSRAQATRSASSAARCRKAAAHGKHDMDLTREQIAQRAAAGAARRLLRQPRHRHADARRQLHPAGRRGRPPERERPARHRPVPVEGRTTTPTSSTPARRPSRCSRARRSSRAPTASR